MSKNDIPEFREKLNKELSRRSVVVSSIKQEEIYFNKSKTELYVTKKAQRVIQQVAKSIQQQAHQKISSVVSQCLQMVLDDSYSFKIEFVERRGKTEADIFLMKDGNVLDPMDATGGGVADIASFALRIAILSIRAPAVTKFVCLDEAFRNVSEDLRPKVKQMLTALSEELGFQFFISTHQKELVGGKVVEL